MSSLKSLCLKIVKVNISACTLISSRCISLRKIFINSQLNLQMLQSGLSWLQLYSTIKTGLIQFTDINTICIYGKLYLHQQRMSFITVSSSNYIPSARYTFVQSTYIYEYLCAVDSLRNPLVPVSL